MFLIRRGKLIVKPLDFALCLIEILLQLLLVTLLERRRNLAVNLIDFLIEGPELLLRVFEIGF